MPASAGVVTGRGDLDPDAGVGRDRSGRHRVSRRPGDGSRLTGHHRLVHRGGSVDDAAVCGNTPTGSDHDEVAHDELGGRDFDDLVTLDPFRLIGKERGERIERGCRLRERAHLDPVPEEHDHDQECELPPELELMMKDAEGGTPRCEERDGDGKPDEEHHPGLARPDLADGTGEERPSAPHVHHGAEHRRDVARPSGHLVPEDHREHRRERHDRHRDQEIDPEQAPELADVVAMTTVTAVTIPTAATVSALTVVAVTVVAVTVGVVGLVPLRACVDVGFEVHVVRVRIGHWSSFH
ncbi:hypothetical protein QFZ46_001629 [Microbacterium murale]|uniref:Uncharacterized protein n=1 Tax=Microbacterium murale TaxID=1081040 RepID=A0ABU0P813_9MICO|nr:hypothetical protein [Microbacterium murale]